ncbi:hypothetical protein pb186bvf_005385 [Paramecium bursaria]
MDMQPSPIQLINLPSQLNRRSTLDSNTPHDKQRNDEFNLPDVKPYQGPDHELIEDLVQLLRQKEKKKYNVELFERIRLKIESLEGWFEQNAIFFNGRLKLNPYESLMIISYLIMMIIAVIQSIFTSSSESWKSDVTSVFTFMLIYFTIITLLFLKIQSMVFVIIMFFITLVVPSLIVAFGYLKLLQSSEPTYDYQMFTIFGFMAITFLNGLCISQLSRWIAFISDEFQANLVSILWCVLIPYVIGFSIYQYLISTSTLTSSAIITYVTNQLYIPLIIILIFSWFIIKARLFDLPPRLLRNAIEKIREKIERMKVIQMEDQQSQNSFLGKNYKSYISYGIGIVYLTIEISTFIGLAQEIQSSSVDYSVVAVYGFELVSTPIFLIFGVFAAVSDRKQGDTFLYIPLFCGIGPILGCLRLANYLSSYQDMDSLITIVEIAPVLTLIIWLTLSLFGIERRRLQLYFFSFMCIFIVVPIGVIYPIYEQLNNSALKYFGMALILIGLFGILCVFINYLVKAMHQANIIRKISNQSNPTFQQFSYLYLTEYAQYLNAVFFIITYFLLGYLFWEIILDTDNASTDTEAATIYSLIVIHPILMTLINQALQTESLEDTYVQPIPYNDRLQILQKQNRITLIGFILPIVVLVPLSTLFTSLLMAQFLQGTAFGIASSFVLFDLGLKLKHYSFQYQHQLLPLAVIACWCFLIFPFGCIVPIMSAFWTNESTAFQDLAETSVNSGVFIMILGVTLNSLFIYVILDKEEAERTKNNVVRAMHKVYKENNYEGSTSVVAEVYMLYINRVGSICQMQQKTIGDLTEQQIQQIREDQREKLERELIHKKFPLTYVVLPDTQTLNTDDFGIKQQQIVSRCMYLTRPQYDSYMRDQQLNTQVRGIIDDILGILRIIWSCMICKCGLDQNTDVMIEDDYIKSKNDELLELRNQYERLRLVDEALPRLENYQLANKKNINAHLNAEQKLIANPQKFEPPETVLSNKTLKLQQIPFKKIAIKTTDYLQSLKQSDEALLNFMHEIFMEFSNEEQELPPSICYLDFKEFCRLSDIQFEMNNFKKYSSQEWIKQNQSLNEFDFARILSSILDKQMDSPFENLRDLAVNKLYPNLTSSITPLMKNLKSQNRKLLQNTVVYDESPFNPKNFNNQQKLKKFQQESKTHQVSEEQVESYTLRTQVKNNERNALMGKQEEIQKLIDNYLRLQRLEQEKKFGCCRLCCYRTAAWFRKYICYCFYRKEDELPSVQVEISNKQLTQMIKYTEWDLVTQLVLNKMIFQIEAEELRRKQAKSHILNQLQFEYSMSNYLALIFRLIDVYSLAALAYNSQISWYGQATSTNKTQVSGTSFYEQFYYTFGAALAASIIYGLVGRLALTKIDEGTFGKDDMGNKAKLPQWNAILPLIINFLSGQFVRIMTQYINAFICNYDEPGHYYLEVQSSIECMSPEHYYIMGLTIIGVSIYYPLSSFLQPQFQFTDNTLNFKFNSKFQVVYTQAKLIILGSSTLFQNIDNALIFQLITSAIIMGFILVYHIDSHPCYVDWFNTVEQVLLFNVFIIYIAATVILLTEQYIIGLVIVGSMLLISTIFGFIIYKKRQSLMNQVHPDDINEKVYTHSKIKSAQIASTTKEKVQNKQPYKPIFIPKNEQESESLNLSNRIEPEQC